jgi:hypothetical protein
LQGFATLWPLNESLRQHLVKVVDALTDEELHNRLWLRGDRRGLAEESFEDAVLFAIDQHRGCARSTRGSRLVQRSLLDQTASALCGS